MSGQEIGCIKKNGTKVRFFSPDGKYVIIYMQNTSPSNAMWNFDTDEKIPISVPVQAISPDGRIFVTQKKDVLKLVNVKTNEEINQLGFYAFKVYSFSPDGRWILTGKRKDITKYSYDLKNKPWFEKVEEMERWGKPNYRYYLELISVNNPSKQGRIFEGHTNEVTKCEFSPDGKYIISGSKDKTLKIWEVATCNELFSLKGYTDSIEACSISPDGQKVAIGDELGQLLFANMENIKFSISFITPTRFWNYSEEQKKYLWSKNITSICIECGMEFLVPNKILAAIDSIHKDANLSASQSPCHDLPSTAWEDPRLLSECLHCHKPLRFNPFIVDNKEEYLRKSIKE